MIVSSKKNQTGLSMEKLRDAHKILHEVTKCEWCEETATHFAYQSKKLLGKSCEEHITDLKNKVFSV